MGNSAQTGVGTQFGKFLLLKKLASGGMGEIFLAKQSGPVGFEKILVIKRILQHHLDNKQYVDMFFSEARTAAMLSHSNVVQVYDMGEVDEHFYIAMEYVHGRSLKEVVNRANQTDQTIPLAYIADFIAQAASGMSYSHNLKDSTGQPLNLIHRDINPHNILVSYNGEIKVIDFGIAKSTLSANKTETGTIKGKFVYMSPEQSAAEVLDKRSDIFSLGIVLYEMLAGKNPFQRDNIVLSLEAIQRRDPPPIVEMRSDAETLQPILDRCLAKKRDDRYFDCSELRSDLMRLIDNKVLQRPEHNTSDWLAMLFADRIEEDRQILLETGSGMSQAFHAGGSDASATGEAETSRPMETPLSPSAPTQGLEISEVQRAIGDVFSESGEARVLATSPHSPLYDGGSDGETIPARSAAIQAKAALFDEAFEPGGGFDDEHTVRYDSASMSTAQLSDGDSIAPDAATQAGILDVDLEPSLIAPSPSRKVMLVGGVAGAVLLLLVVAWAASARTPKSVAKVVSPSTGDTPGVLASPPARHTGGPLAETPDAGRAFVPPVADAAPPATVVRPDAASTATVVAQTDTSPGVTVRQPDAGPVALQGSRKDAGRPPKHKRRPARDRAARPDKSRPRPAVALGSLMVNPGPNFKISYAGQGGRGAQALSLKRARGQIKLRQISGSLELTLSFVIKNGSCQLRVDARPWAIVSKDGVSVGRTPQRLGRSKRFRLDLKSPQLNSPVRLIVFYREQD